MQSMMRQVAVLASEILAGGLVVVLVVTYPWLIMKFGRENGSAEVQIWKGLAVKLVTIMLGFPLAIVVTYWLRTSHALGLVICSLVAGAVGFYYISRGEELSVAILGAIAIIIATLCSIEIGFLGAVAVGFHYIRQARGIASAVLGALVIGFTVFSLAGVLAVNMFGE